MQCHKTLLYKFVKLTNIKLSREVIEPNPIRENLSEKLGTSLSSTAKKTWTALRGDYLYLHGTGKLRLEEIF